MLLQFLVGVQAWFLPIPVDLNAAIYGIRGSKENKVEVAITVFGC